MCVGFGKKQMTRKKCAVAPQAAGPSAGVEAYGQTPAQTEASTGIGPSEGGKAYLESVEGLRLQTEIRYLPPESGLDEAPVTEEAVPATDRSAPLQWGGTTVLG